MRDAAAVSWLKMAEQSHPVSIDALLAHRAWVRRVARAIVADDARADDLEQEAWLRALRRPPQHRRSLRAWLGTVLRRAAVDQGRADATRARHESGSPTPDRSERSPDELIGQAELGRVVTGAVLALDEPYRTTVLLRFYEDLTPAEIAARQAVPVQTVRTRLRRAMDRLRVTLDREDRGGARVIALLLLGRRPEPHVPAAVARGGPWKSSILGTLGGITLMATKTKIVLATIVIVVLGAATWRATTPSVDSDPTDETARIARRADATERNAPRDAAEKPLASDGASTPPPPALTGRVVDARTQAPIDGAQLRIGGWDVAPDDEVAATSDADGSFSVAGSPSSDFKRLLVSAPDYMTAAVSLSRRDPAESLTVTLQRGRPVRGRVVDVDGRTPIAGATILLAPTDYHWLSNAVPIGVSGADGSFAVSIAEQAGQASRGVLLALSGRRLGWVRLPVVAGREDLSEIDVALRDGARLHVVVRNASGQAVEGATVALSPSFDPDLSRSWTSREDYYGLGFVEQRLFRAKSDASGTADLTVPAGATATRYGLRAWATGQTAKASTTVRLKVETTIDISLLDIVKWSILVRVEDSEGQPIEGATVRRRGLASSSSTAPDGSVRFDGLASDWVPLEFSAPGYAPIARRIDRPEEGHQVEVRTVLERATPIEGRVVDTEGVPLEGIYVDLQRKDSDASLSPVTTGPDGAFSFPGASAGAWSLRVYPPTRWITDALLEVNGGDRDILVRLEHIPRGAATFVVDVVDEATGSPLDMLDIQLCHDGAHFGPQPAGETAIERGRVTIMKMNAGRSRLWLRFADRPPTSVPIEIASDDDRVQRRIEVGPGGALAGRVDFGASIERTRFIDVRPTHGSSIPSWASYVSSGMTGGTRIRDDGTFDANGLAPGRYRLTVQTEDSIAEIEADVISGRTTQVRVELKPAGIILFESADPCPSDVVNFAVARDGEPWRTIGLTGGERGEAFRFRKPLVPGRLRWRVVFASRVGAPSAADSQEGELVLEAGKTTVVQVPVVLRSR